jgi:1-acyl-sn-glycerol-3-phosphate acyltransferase
LKPEDIEYIKKTPWQKIKTKFAFFLAYRFASKAELKNQLIIDDIIGAENLKACEGVIFTANHFSPFDNYAVWKAVKPFMKGRKLYKIIREGNYTNPPKPFGLFMRHCNTLPLSSKPATMKKFVGAVSELLSRGESILIYPEQSMWWNYRKPKPMQDGAFSLAVTNNVPVVPIFITMEDSDVLDNDGFAVQEYTLHILPAIYPDNSLSLKAAKNKMKEENYTAWVKVYESFYGEPLIYLK